jgi:hypothetical protein
MGQVVRLPNVAPANFDVHLSEWKLTHPDQTYTLAVDVGSLLYMSHLKQDKLVKFLAERDVIMLFCLDGIPRPNKARTHLKRAMSRLYQYNICQTYFYELHTRELFEHELKIIHLYNSLTPSKLATEKTNEGLRATLPKECSSTKISL